ncbi:TerB family tellurite resistance protein [Fulvivirga sedimenti]|uniref:TerB family tellurite resistance protein n=1 Tax=Fulvivirga sedimenti TaxID=2879465 RepID=A0A9X1KWC1_9BACT|nr:TerB family tellurite resistance protein [Fulvivirga sedimenti]MCA6073834.1 TerB family tellurite resistance protein [Fulvivirga sedimenti]
MDIVTRKQLNILIQLAQADKHFSEKERELIYNLARKKNFPPEGVRELIREPEPIGSFGALSENQRFDYLYNCIDLMLIDKKIFDSELLFCHNIAIKLDFKKSVVDYLKDNLHQHEYDELKHIVFRDFT